MLWVYFENSGRVSLLSYLRHASFIRRQLSTRLYQTTCAADDSQNGNWAWHKPVCILNYCLYQLISHMFCWSQGSLLFMLPTVVSAIYLYLNHLVIEICRGRNKWNKTEEITRKIYMLAGWNRSVSFLFDTFVKLFMSKKTTRKAVVGKLKQKHLEFVINFFVCETMLVYNYSSFLNASFKERHTASV